MSVTSARAVGTSAETGRRPRSPGIVYSALAVSFGVLIAAIALTTRQTPPPSTAEFAPQAIEQIKDAPNDQSSDFGSGSGPGGAPGRDEAAAQAHAAAGGTKPPIAVPRVRRCVGSPPRQTEDPQSPPCVPYWEGDNGGATYRGVSRDEIRLEIKVWIGPPGSLEALESYFNKRYEFYGRRLRFIDTGADLRTSPADQRAAAAETAEQVKAFASFFGNEAGQYYFHEELARRGVIGLSYQNTFTETQLARTAPYLWEYPMAPDRIFPNLGEWGCKRLAGKKAAYAGTSDGEDLRTRTREFGLIMMRRNQDDPVTPQPLIDELRRCGVRPAVSFDWDPSGDAKINATNVILQMKDAGVTSIYCLCHSAQTTEIYRAATAQLYFPEWLISSYMYQDYNGTTRGKGHFPEQLAHTFGLSFNPKQLKLEDNPTWWALKEGDPGASRDRYGMGNAVLDAVMNLYYRAFLMLASGIQMAGPNLTPHTFQEGLFRTRFPNPDHPAMAGKVNFIGDHSMTDDAAEIWWSNTAVGPYDDDQGTFCYVDGGVRYSKGVWPSTTDKFFQGTCDSGA